MDLTAHDARRQRCRRLGHEVPFVYCRTQADGRLCTGVLNCWWECFDVEAFLAATCPSELDRVRAHVPVSRLGTLVDLAREARARSG